MHGHLASVTDWVDYIPVAATVVTTLLSVVLARATLRYAEAADKSLALAREEFEREWSPELHVKLERLSATEANIIVTNLARISVLLQLVQIRKLTHAMPFERHYLNEPLVGGMTWTQSIRKRLIISTGEDFVGAVAASVTFYASGRLFRTDWFRFQVTVKNGHILQLEPISMAVRRVRVLEPRRGMPAGHRELVTDVAAPVANAATAGTS
jgi:hypothetical protein